MIFNASILTHEAVLAVPHAAGRGHGILGREFAALSLSAPIIRSVPTSIQKNGE